MTQKLAPVLALTLLSALAVVPAPALACGGGYGRSFVVPVPTERELVTASALSLLDVVDPGVPRTERRVEELGIEGERAQIRLRSGDTVHVLWLAVERGTWVVRGWRARSATGARTVATARVRRRS